MQNTTQILSKNSDLGYNLNFSIVKPFCEINKVSEKYNELLLIYKNKYNSPDIDFAGIELLVNQLVSICLANEINKRKFVKAYVCTKLLQKQKQYNYFIGKLESINQESTLSNLIVKLKNDETRVAESINQLLTKPIKFPKISSNKIISKEKYAEILAKRYRKLVPLFDLLHNDDYVDEYNELRRLFKKFFIRAEAINLFKNIYMVDYEFVKLNYQLIDEIHTNYLLIQKMEKYAAKFKSNLELEIENVENSLFDLMISFDQNINVLKDSIQRMLK